MSAKDNEKEIVEDSFDEPVTLIARAMNALSVGERETCYEELHGVADHVRESPEFLEEKLAEFDQATLIVKNKPAYDRAFDRCPEYVESERTKFLRSENYDPAKAAKRMVNFFQAKLELWGEDSLHRPIRMSDFSEDDKVAFESGVAQLLPSRDSAGRAVVTFFHQECHAYYRTPENMMRAVWYTLMSALEDEETQRLGFIFIDYSLGEFTEGRHYNPHLSMPITKVVLSCLPCKVAGLHLCFDDSKMHKLYSFFISLLGAAVTTRLRLHCGSHTECQYQLMGFGIAVDSMPVSYNGERKLKNYKKWIKRRYVKEEALSQNEVFEGVDLPGRFDVLLGRGRPSQVHAGNIRFLDFISRYKSAYDDAPKGKKKELAERVLGDFLEQATCRFLRRETNGWYFDVLESSRKEILNKVFEALRVSKSLEKPHDGTTSSSPQQRVQDGQDPSSSLKRAKVI